MEEAVERAILSLTSEQGAAKSISPEQAARAADPEGTWLRLMPVVRRVAVRLAAEGRIVITRKGKPVDPGAFKGVYRLKAIQPSDWTRSESV
jgi:hypothetical protein